MPKQNKNKVHVLSESESSDSDSSSSVDSNDNQKSSKMITQSSQKKRGRPKKNTVQPKQKPVQKISLPIKEKEQDNEEQLILHIPIYEDEGDSSEKNMFTMKDDSDFDENVKKENRGNSLKLIDSLTDSENEESEKSNEYDMKSLLTELKKKDLMIKKLKMQIVNQKNGNNYDNAPVFTKDANKKIINLKLFDINNENKPIVVDKTGIACWWCAHNFDTMPCFIPDRYINGIVSKFYVFGCFCTYSCAMKYNSNMGDHRSSIRTSLIKELCNTIFGTTDLISEAPEKEVLQKFGGPMSIEDFRNANLLCKKEFKIKIPPMIPLMVSVEEIYKDPSQNPKNTYKKK